MSVIDIKVEGWPPEARAALLRYGRHAIGCAFYLALTGCSCGWEDLRRRLEVQP